MQKLIPKIDAEKELIGAFMDPEMSYKGTKGGAPGGKEGKPPKAALRHLASLSETPNTGQCRRIVVRGDRRHLEILAVEAIIFIHETGGHW